VRASHENSKDKYPLNTKEFVPSEMGEVYTTGTYKDAHSVTTAAGFSKLKDFLLRMIGCPAALGVMPGRIQPSGTTYFQSEPPFRHMPYSQDQEKIPSLFRGCKSREGFLIFDALISP
jgi:hypothetical protein